jgi:hypothetical protein
VIILLIAIWIQSIHRIEGSSKYSSFLKPTHSIKGCSRNSVSKLHLIGFTYDPEGQSIHFGLFLSVHLVTVLGNMLVILALKLVFPLIHAQRLLHLQGTLGCPISSLSFKDDSGDQTSHRSISHGCSLTQKSFKSAFHMCMK